MPTPAEQPEISVKNMLFTNWQTTPGADTIAETFVPTKVHFTTRYWATRPQRIHPFQVSVLAGPARKTPEEVGSIVIYKVEEQLSIHVWAVAGIGIDWEKTENNLRAMLTHIDDILRIAAVKVTGIQFVRVSPGWKEQDDRQRRLVLHRVAEITAIYYETLTSLPIPITLPALLADIGSADQNSAG